MNATSDLLSLPNLLFPSLPFDSDSSASLMAGSSRSAAARSATGHPRRNADPTRPEGFPDVHWRSDLLDRLQARLTRYHE